MAGLSQALDLPVPTPAIIVLADGFGNAEPDPGIQDILRGSIGENVGLAFLSGALAFDPAADRDSAPELAAKIVWLDALTTNVDRTSRNTNLLVWQHQLWLIDHGAALYVHHRWEGRRFGASHLSADTLEDRLGGADAHIEQLRQVRDLVRTSSLQPWAARTLLLANSGAPAPRLAPPAYQSTCLNM